VVDADKVLTAFLVECHKAGPFACDFYASTPAAIARNLDALHQKVLTQPIPAYSPDLSKYGFVDHPTFKNAVLASFYQPYSTFSMLAEGLAALKNGDGSIMYQLSFLQGSEAALAIACGDGAKVTDDAAKLQKYTNSIDKTSSF